jgi:hypothetical protein
VSVRPPRVLAPLLFVCALLFVPGNAAAAPIQFGSPLTPGPSGLFGCSVRPGGYDTSGNVLFFQNLEAGGCTWSQAGVSGLNSGSDPRARSVPADGRIVAAEILSGANPSPIWITIIRQLATPGPGETCCFWRSDTGPFPLAPNAVTTIPLNIPVERNLKESVLAYDLVSVSAENDGGTLPLREVGPHNVLSIPDGNPMAGAFYPRMGRIPNDEKGGRHEIYEGVPGIELLVRWTFCATGDITCAGAPVPPGPTVPLSPVTPKPVVPRLGSRQAQVERNKASITLVCGGDAACEGTLELLSRTARRRAAGASTARPAERGVAIASAAVKAKPATIVYGKAAYKLAAGTKGKVAVKLNRLGKGLLKKRSQATVTLRMTPKGGAATTAKLTLKRVAKGH